DDATSCIVKAVEAAADKEKYPRGATVVFEARTYKLRDPGQWAATGDASSRQVDFEGILVPKHVNLRGAGPGASIIERGKGWVTTRNARGAATTPITSLFNLQGDNTVEGLTFSDENVYSENSTRGIAALALGVGSLRARSLAPRDPTLSHIIITHNE